MVSGVRIVQQVLRIDALDCNLYVSKTYIFLHSHITLLHKDGHKMHVIELCLSF